MASLAKSEVGKTVQKAPDAVPILNRFTSLPIALDVLYKKRIILLSPETWEDRNDAYYLERYRAEMKLSSLLAICFSLRSETFHHWRVFSSGLAGVCIEFDKSKLLQSITTKEGFRHEKVSYHWIGDLKKKKPRPESWPFLKRKPFEDEREYRITFESKTASLRERPIPIDLSFVRKVTLSPWLSGVVADSVIRTIKTIGGCAHLDVSLSSLINNAGWRAIIDPTKDPDKESGHGQKGSKT
jgi:hypothetical protein